MVDRVYPSIHLDSGSEVKTYLVRLLTYLPGRPIAEIPISPQLLYEIGKLAAKLDKTLEVRFGGFILFIRIFYLLVLIYFIFKLHTGPDSLSMC